VAKGSESEQVDGSGNTATPEASLAPNLPSAVFISYASPDAAIADALCAALEREGITCWIVERCFAWLQWQRRLLVRWEYYYANFLGFVTTFR
jgi:hypothetical protein